MFSLKKIIRKAWSLDAEKKLVKFLNTQKNMTQEEFEALQLKEAPWCGLGPRTRKKKTS